MTCDYTANLLFLGNHKYAPIKYRKKSWQSLTYKNEHLSGPFFWCTNYLCKQKLRHKKIIILIKGNSDIIYSQLLFYTKR